MLKDVSDMKKYKSKYLIDVLKPDAIFYFFYPN